ncbi:hypothetical protein ACWKWU_17595 [Chitinophaga lutea]
MNNPQESLPPAAKEMVLKDFILIVQEWTRFLLKKWKLILLFCLLGAATGFALAYRNKPKYRAELTFILEDGKSNSLGGYAGLASQFGIDLGGGAGNGVLSGDNILAFLKSRLMIEKTLLSPGAGNKKESLASEYIHVNELRKSWKSRPAVADIQFPTGQPRESLSRLQDSILHLLYDRILTYDLSVTKPDKKTSFVAVSFESRSDEFAVDFVQRLVGEAVEFYVGLRTQRSKNIVDKLQAKADSIEAILNKKTYSVAASQDLNLNPGRRVAIVGTELASRDKAVLMSMYSEVVKNLELSRMTMAQETPVIQIIDKPTLPLKRLPTGKVKYTLAGGVLGGFLIMLFLVLVRLYKQIMN